MKLEKIDLEKLFNSKDIPFTVKDFTVYEVVGLEKYSVSFNQNIVAKWVSKYDLDANVSEILNNEDYIGDETDGFLLIGSYCGETELTITEKQTPNSKKLKLVIISRFIKISLDEMRKTIKNNEDANNEWKALCNRNNCQKSKEKKELQIEDKEDKLYEMPTLYEVYVRCLIRKYVTDKNWVVLTGLKQCDTSRGDYKNCNVINATCKKVCDIQKANFQFQNTSETIDAQVYLEGDVIPDIVLKKNNEEEYIIFDVKYKTGKTNAGTRSDRLQILAYAYMWNCKLIGHIFPERSRDDILNIDISENSSVGYIELKCNTEDVFDMDLDKLLKNETN